MRPIGKKNGKLSLEVKISCVVFLAFLIFMIYAVNFLIPGVIDRNLADLYCKYVFEWVALPGNILTGIAIGSVTEMIVFTGTVIGVILIFTAIVRTILYIAGKGNRRFPQHVLNVIVIILVAAIWLSGIYHLMHGINFKRTPAYVRLGIGLQNEAERPFDEYLTVLNWAYMGMVQNRKKLGEDYAGVAHLSSSYEQCVTDANILLDSFSYTYGMDMSSTFIRAKAVSLSNLWSSTHIVGFYDAFLGESNINTDYLDVLDFPHTLCHEIIHAKGYARESDANIIAALALIHSDRADFKYAGYYYIFQNLYPTVSDYAVATGNTIPNYYADELCSGVITDMRASFDYWDYIDNRFMADKIEEISEEVNNGFLEANGQEGGTETYHVPPNVFVEFYYMYVAGNTDG